MGLCEVRPDFHAVGPRNFGKAAVPMSQLFDMGKPPSFGEVLWRVAAKLTRAGILSLAERYSKDDGFFTLSVVPRYSATDPAQLFEDLGCLFLSVSTRVSAQQSGLTVLHLRDEDRQLSGYAALVPGRFDGVWLLVTDMKRSSPEYHHLIEPVLHLMSSRVPGAWLTTSALQDVLFELENRLSVTLTPGRVSSHNRERSSVEYMHQRRPLNEVFAELRSRELVLRSLEFTGVAKDGRRVLVAGIDKWMRLRYRGGSSLAFDQYLVSAVEVRLRRHVRALAVRRDEALSGNPIVFRFSRDVLTNRERNQELIDTLASQSHVSVCAFHVNPYLHVALVDHHDGSSMDLFADDPSMLAVIPGKRCSVAAVSRTFDRVYAHFASGSIADLEHVSMAGDDVGA